MKYVYFFLVFLSNVTIGQVLITDISPQNNPDPSAILELRSNNKGILLPKIFLTSLSDVVSIPNPAEALFVENTNTAINGRFSFFDGTKWINTLEEDVLVSLFDIVENVTASSTSKTRITTFPTSDPLFSVGSNTTGWTSLGVTKNFSLTRAVNSVSFSVEGMNQVDNSATTDYKYAIGVFINGKLVTVRKFYYNKLGACSWNKFNLSSVVKDLPIGNHTIEVRATNLSKVSTAYSEIVYGGSAGNCANLNEDVARILLNVDVVQRIN